jgi:hypothetical protein
MMIFGGGGKGCCGKKKCWLAYKIA